MFISYIVCCILYLMTVLCADDYENTGADKGDEQLLEDTGTSSSPHSSNKQVPEEQRVIYVRSICGTTLIGTQAQFQLIRKIKKSEARIIVNKDKKSEQQLSVIIEENADMMYEETTPSKSEQQPLVMVEENADMMYEETTPSKSEQQPLVMVEKSANSVYWGITPSKSEQQPLVMVEKSANSVYWGITPSKSEQNNHKYIGTGNQDDVQNCEEQKQEICIETFLNWVLRTTRRKIIIFCISIVILYFCVLLVLFAVNDHICDSKSDSFWCFKSLLL